MTYAVVALVSFTLGFVLSFWLYCRVAADAIKKALKELKIWPIHS